MDKIQSVQPNEVAGHIGDMINMENALSFKKFFKTLHYLRGGEIE